MEIYLSYEFLNRREKKIERPNERMDSPQRFEDNSTDIFSPFALLLGSYECVIQNIVTRQKCGRKRWKRKNNVGSAWFLSTKIVRSEKRKHVLRMLSSADEQNGKR